MEPLKSVYSEAFLTALSKDVEFVLPAFNQEVFLQETIGNHWEELELKQRMKTIAESLIVQLPEPFHELAKVLDMLLIRLQNRVHSGGGFAYMFLPNILELKGMENPHISFNLMERMTTFTSCEFAIRPFILRYPSTSMDKMLEWSKHSNLHVRRLASEGCRPRLPWARELPFLKKDPTPIIPILETLKSDVSEYVRRSVANNLNDISKDHPDKVLQISNDWMGINKETDWVVKHACRTLLKQGCLDAMAKFGLTPPHDIEVDKLLITTPIVAINDYLQFEFMLKNNNSKTRKLRLEYAIHYLKANGSHTKKVFKISEKEYRPYATTQIARRQSFKLISTRKFHIGKHFLSVIINGVEIHKKLAFTLTK